MLQALRDFARSKEDQKVLIKGASGGHYAVQRSLNSDRLFFSGMALLILGIVIVGFAPTFYLAPLFPDRPAPTERFFYLKGVIFSAWFLLLPVQCGLIASRRVVMHRTLGIAGAGIAVLMVISGIWGALIAAGRPGGFIAVSAPPLMFLVEPLFDIMTFASLVGLALIWRRDAASHKRLMLLGSLAIIDAAAARLPFVPAVHPIWGPVAMVVMLVLALAAYDFSTKGRFYLVTLWAGGALILSFPLRLLIGASATWQQVAATVVEWAR
jgi:uncharacterized membrane protein YozB (DUF420 family)